MRIPVRAIPCLLLLLLSLLVSGVSVASDEFGRFFTTPAQRETLEELRAIEPEQRIKIEEEELVDLEETEDEEEFPVDALTVRGLVYRQGGKSTAWINNSNTFEGGLSSQYINVGNIENNKVEIKIPSAEKNVKLNVGQTFDPVSENYQDVVRDPTATLGKAAESAEQQ